MNKKNENKVNTYNNLIINGINKAKEGELYQSKEIFLKAISLNKKEYKAYINLSNISILQNNIVEAQETLKKYILKNNYNVEALKYFYNICQKYNHENTLIKFLDKLETLDSNLHYDNQYYLYYLKANFYDKSNQTQKALQYFLKSIQKNKNFHESYINYLDLLERTNNLKEFKEVINIYKNNNQKNNKILFFESLLLNRDGDFKKSEKIIIENKLESAFLNDDKFYLKILNLRSINNERLKNYSNAIKLIKKRNLFIINSNEVDYLKENISNTIFNYKKIYNKKNFDTAFNKHINLKKDYKDPVFLIGFPRSGTTLLDTILRSHSKTIVLEEKPYISNAKDIFFKKNNNNLESILNITPKEIIEIRSNYFNQIETINKHKDKIIIDKLPLTMPELGFIKMIFPESKIILALRHPCDVVVSCFFTSFKQNKAMANFLDWNETLDFYNNIFTLFEFYENQIPLNCFKIKYEKIVNNFKNEIMKLLKFLDLKFENNILLFYKTAQKRDKISTPSYTQVINPLYKSSIGRWENYKEFLNFDDRVMGWVNKFNY